MAVKLIPGFFRILMLIFDFVSLAGCSGCDAGFTECLGGSNHSFEQKILFVPEQLQYHIGDTIQISTNFSCLDMLNLITGLKEDYCGAKSIEATLQILNIARHFPADSLNYIYSFENFDIVPIEGSVIPYNFSSQSIFFQIKDNEYGFKLVLIPKVAGKYAVFVSDSGPVRLPDSDRCDAGSFGLSNGNNDNNMVLLEAYTSPGQVGEYERVHGYCLEVIE